MAVLSSSELGLGLCLRAIQLHGGAHGVMTDVIGPSSSSEVARNGRDNLWHGKRRGEGEGHV